MIVWSKTSLVQFLNFSTGPRIGLVCTLLWTLSPVLQRVCVKSVMDPKQKIFTEGYVQLLIVALVDFHMWNSIPLKLIHHSRSFFFRKVKLYKMCYRCGITICIYKPIWFEIAAHWLILYCSMVCCFSLYYNLNHSACDLFIN